MSLKKRAKDCTYQQTGLPFLFLRASAALFVAEFSTKLFAIENPEKMAIGTRQATQMG